MTDEVKNYTSTVGNADSRKFETFSYLPEMDADRLLKQVNYLIEKGFNPAIEHIEPENAFEHYWYMWKLPMFGERSANRILSEIEECHAANPGHHVRLVGYDNFAQSRGAEMVVKRGKAV